MLIPAKSDSSREAILHAAFQEFWTKGYNGTRVDEIIEKTAFTKGAFYHHFSSKKALVCAVIDEIIGAILVQRWLGPLKDAENPFAVIIERLRAARVGDGEGIRRGCPLNNLAQELAGTDDDIRELTDRYFQEWVEGFTSAIEVSRDRKQIRQDVDPRQLATTIVASYEGAVSLSKAARDVGPLFNVLDGLIQHMESLQI